MKKLILVGLLLGAVAVNATSAVAQNIQSIEIGKSPPMADVKMKSVDKKEVSLSDAQAKNGLIVMFSCNTCPYVVKSQERTKEIMKYATERGIGMIIVNSN